MKSIGSLIGVGVTLGLLTLATRLLGLDGLVRESIIEGRLLDWVMGALSLLWLLVLLKAPWDLFFQAHIAAFEQQRARERGIVLEAGREQYITVLRRRLLAIAIGSHLVSALIIASVAFFTHRVVGYWFAGFYLIATLFRPAVAGYSYLRERLAHLTEETAYPRHDVVELRSRVSILESELVQSREALSQQEERNRLRDMAQTHELAELRQRVVTISQEFSTAASRFTDQKSVIEGLQAIARLVKTV
jgi:hypothetical protein